MRAHPNTSPPRFEFGDCVMLNSFSPFEGKYGIIVGVAPILKGSNQRDHVYTVEFTTDEYPITRGDRVKQYEYKLELIDRPGEIDVSVDDLMEVIYG